MKENKHLKINEGKKKRKNTEKQRWHTGKIDEWKQILNKRLDKREDGQNERMEEGIKEYKEKINP